MNIEKQVKNITEIMKLNVGPTGIFKPKIQISKRMIQSI